MPRRRGPWLQIEGVRWWVVANLVVGIAVTVVVAIALAGDARGTVANLVFGTIAGGALAALYAELVGSAQRAAAESERRQLRGPARREVRAAYRLAEVRAPAVSALAGDSSKQRHLDQLRDYCNVLGFDDLRARFESDLERGDLRGIYLRLMAALQEGLERHGTDAVRFYRLSTHLDRLVRGVSPWQDPIAVPRSRLDPVSETDSDEPTARDLATMLGEVRGYTGDLDVVAVWNTIRALRWQGWLDDDDLSLHVAALHAYFLTLDLEHFRSSAWEDHLLAITSLPVRWHRIAVRSHDRRAAAPVSGPAAGWQRPARWLADVVAVPSLRAWDRSRGRHRTRQLREISIGIRTHLGIGDFLPEESWAIWSNASSA